MRNIKKLGAVGIILMMLTALLVAPSTAYACHISCGGFCIFSDGRIEARVCASGEISVYKWELYQDGYGKVAEGTVSPEVTFKDACEDFTWDASSSVPVTRGTYELKIYYHYGDSEDGYDTIDEYGETCPPVPELSTIALMSVGLLAMGGFVWMKRRNSSVAAA